MLRLRLFSALVALAIFTSACAPPTLMPTPTPKPKVAEATATATALPSATPAAPAGEQLAPDGDPKKNYYAPFPVKINLDGDLADWQGIPKVLLAQGNDPATSKASLVFAAASDGKNLYLMGDVTKANIISGQHEENYWNEDSIEFYVNATGNLGLTNYVDGVAQITIPALNVDRAPGDVILAGINGPTVGAQATVKKTATGYAVELALPLDNNVWNIPAEHGSTIGFQAHLNGATETNRDIKLIWSLADAGDNSYQNPSVFGQLIFFEIGKTDKPRFDATATPLPTATLPPPAADALYRNPQASVEERVQDLLARMSLGEKIGQMTQVEKNSLTNAAATDYAIGSVLSGGGGYPSPNTPEQWSKMIYGYFQRAALRARLSIPILYGVDAVHGHNNVAGAVIFPHNIGLGAANDEELMTRIGQVTAAEMAATGANWNFAPVIAVPQDIRWGRAYEGYGENTDLVTRLGVAYMKGLQGDLLTDPLAVLATPKHYIGDGGTAWGTSTTNDYKLDQGVTEMDEATLRALFLPPYVESVRAGARSIMVSYSSWDGIKMHGQKYLITDVLKGELGFSGFIISDWAGVDQVTNNYYTSLVASINAGVDMVMVPQDYRRFVNTLSEAVRKGDVPQSRIDDAVTRILRVKFEMGLFERSYKQNAELLAKVGSEEHRAVAREAVAKSLVLLKNEGGALPLSKSAPLLYVAGIGADDIGMQSGGWTIEWQGKMGDITPGTTLLEAINATVTSSATVEYKADGSFEAGKQADACVVVVGEQPYAEGIGDKEDLTLSAGDIELTKTMRPLCKKMIVVLYSGRPLVVTEQLPDWDALVAAWLPGTEGQGLADVLFGDKPFTGKLPFTWPRSNDQLPFDFTNLGEGEQGPLFPYGFGLK